MRTLADWAKARENLERLRAKFEDRIKARILRQAQKSLGEKERDVKPTPKRKR